ncbi:hypothetical protein U1763_02570 [Sphingomonas sp. LB2R24]|uniref:hypothetical protein n=1 Tax=Sphingomonas sorbitolis TaxID=3096165 RepID=UPI002FC9C15F
MHFPTICYGRPSLLECFINSSANTAVSLAAADLDWLGQFARKSTAPTYVSSRARPVSRVG